MATEDPDKIDKLLKRYAKERREQGGDFALHEATRRVLQGEVARQFRAREPEADRAKGGFISWLGLWRGRLALGGAVAAAVVLGVLMFGSGSKRDAIMQLAKNDNFANESRLMERENVPLGDKTDPRAAGQPSAPMLARGMSFDADRKSVEQLAKLKESQVAVATTSGSLTPVQNSPVDGIANHLSDEYSIALKQKAENSHVSVPLALGRQTNLPAGFAFNQTDKLFYESGGGAGGPVVSFALPPGSSPVIGRYVSASTNALAANGASSLGAVTALSLQPQLAYSFDAGTAGLAAAPNEPAPRSEVLSRSLALPAQVGLRGGADKPAALGDAGVVAAAPTPASAATPPPEAFGVERRMALASEEQKLRSRMTTGFTSPTGGARPVAKGEAMVFYRQSALGLQDNLPSPARRGDLVRVQTDTVPAKSDAALEVLSQFTVELNGGTIRLTDADQSVYEGVISTEEVAPGLEAGKDSRLEDAVRAEKRALPKAAAPVKGPARNYSFRAVGSNATLKQVVIVNGRLSGADGLGRGAIAPTTDPAQSRGKASSGVVSARGAAAIPTNTTVIVEGTVQVGGTNEQRFRAVRSPR